MFLGRMVTPEGVTINPDSENTIKNWPVPSCIREVESFLRFANYHREFVKGYVDISASLYTLTGPKARFSWTAEADKAFESLKNALINAPVLPFPDARYKFVLDCDASDVAVAGELGQIVDGKVQIIAYGSYVLDREQRKYCTTRKEVLAVIRLTRQFRHYLLGRPFLIRTDHNSLTWLMGFKNIQGQLARWLEELAEYDMTILHCQGKKHVNADCLSRIPDPLPYCNCYQAGKSPDRLPCGGCPFCQRAHKQWARFEEEVNDVVPLAVRALSEASSIEEGWIERYTSQEIRSHQLDDPDLAPLISWLEGGREPSQAELTLT